MNFDAKKLNFFTDVLEKEFPKESTNFNTHIQKLTQDWSASGFELNSLLTPGKSSIEFSCNFNKPSISYTVDVGLASDAPDKKWRFLDAFLEETVLDKYPFLIPFSLDKNQKYGTWLSVRHIDAEAYYKVYQEVSSAMQNEARASVLERYPRLGQIPFYVKLIGVTMSSSIEKPEYYMSLGYINEAVLFEAMTLASVQSLTPYFISQMSALTGKSYDTVLSDIKVGLSLKETDGNPIMTLFFHAPELFPDNRIAIKKIKALALNLGCDTSLYNQLTKNVLSSHVKTPIHSILSFKFSNQENFQLSVGLSPC